MKRVAVVAGEARSSSAGADIRVDDEIYKIAKCRAPAIEVAFRYVGE